jgi:hypothetical protein
MHPVIFSPYIGIATINVMQRSMHGVLMKQAISLRSRMRGKLSCPVLKAGRRERSLLPSYQNGVHYVKDVTLGEDKSTVHADNGPKIMAALRNTALSLLRRAGFSTIAARMRYNSTHPQAALEVLSLSLF